MDNLNIIASDKNWIDSRGVEALKEIAQFNDVQKVVGLPDLGVGYAPNGMAVLTKDNIFPHLIGGDIGCGMSLYELPFSHTKTKKIKVEKFEKKLSRLESLEDVEIEGYKHLGYNLGTIGKGNHFAELHLVNEIKDIKIFEDLGLSTSSLYGLIHSGSRALGQIVFNRVSGKYDPQIGIEATSKEAVEYIEEHNKAIDLAHKSREIIAKRLFRAIGLSEDIRKVSDTAHNSITLTDEGYLHRKGATPTNKGAVIIAGSRGSLSYLVMPTGDTQKSNYSLSHGAGRKWERKSAEAKLREKYTLESLHRTKIGSRVLCKDKKLLYEEAPQAYKNIDIVINDLVQAGLATVIATFKPILTYKE